MAIEAATLAVVTHGLFARVKTGRVREGPGERGKGRGERALLPADVRVTHNLSRALDFKWPEEG